MTTATSEPRLITPTEQPAWPAWLWFAPDGGSWRLRTVNPHPSWSDVSLMGYTHWLPATPPTVEPHRSPVVPCTMVELDRALRRIADYEEAERSIWAGWRAEAEQLRSGIDALLSELGVSTQPGHNPNRLHTLELQVRAHRKGWMEIRHERDKANAQVSDLTAQLESLKCSHSDVADLYTKEKRRADNLSDGLRTNAAVLKSVECRAERAEAEVTRLKGQLETAEQHFKILREERDTATRQRNQATREVIAAQEAAKVAPPKREVRPWRADEVPLGCWLRRPEHPDVRWTIFAVSPQGVRWHEHFVVTFGALMDGYEHSIDGGKTWQPAGRVVEAGVKEAA